MAPELDPGMAEKIVEGRRSGKFVRQRDSIWVGASVEQHRVIAEKAGFGDTVDDAGIYMSRSPDTIIIGGSSTGFNTKEDGQERDKTIEIAQQVVGDYIKIVKSE